MYRRLVRSLSILVILSVVFMIGACAGAPPAPETETRPAEKQTAGEEVPDWVLSPPESDDQYEYFTGSASDERGDLAAAEDAASNEMVSAIIRYMGVRITEETTASAKASLDSFETSVEQEIRQTGSARISGFKLVDRYIEKENGRVTVYLLGRYNKSDLLKEKRRLEELFQERIRAVEGVEEEGKALEASGDYFAAATKYIEAAMAAVNTNIDNAEVKFERNINNAKQVISRIELQKLNDNLQATLGKEFSEPFRLKVVANISGREEPLSGANIRISYKILRRNGRPGIETINMQTDQKGTVAFEHPVPEIVGRQQVTMALDLSALLNPLSDVPRKLDSYVDGLQDQVVDKQVRFDYYSVSRAKEIPTGIVILDTDIAGNPTGTSNTASGILESLSSANFRVRSLGFEEEKLASMSDSEVVSSLRNRYGNQVERAIFGVVSLDRFDESGKNYLVRVSGTIKAVDLESGEILYSKNAFKNSRGSSSNAVISSAFKSLGMQLGEELARNLP